MGLAMVQLAATVWDLAHHAWEILLAVLTILLAVAVAVVVVGSVYTVFVIGESGAKAVWSTRV